jgi:hypothetical protein
MNTAPTTKPPRNKTGRHAPVDMSAEPVAFVQVYMTMDQANAGKQLLLLELRLSPEDLARDPQMDWFTPTVHGFTAFCLAMFSADGNLIRAKPISLEDVAARCGRTAEHLLHRARAGGPYTVPLEHPDAPLGFA